LPWPPILQWSSVTGGDDGFSVPTARIGSFVFDSDFKLFYLIIPVTIIMTLLAKNLVNGYIGRAFIALRESEVAAQTIGVDIAKYKTIAFAISAFYTGVAGGLFAYLITFLSPDAFTIELSIDFIAMIVIGGMGSPADLDFWLVFDHLYDIYAQRHCRHVGRSQRKV
jgi:branched-chain amino acid transport system permease protein